MKNNIFVKRSFWELKNIFTKLLETFAKKNEIWKNWSWSKDFLKTAENLIISSKKLCLKWQKLFGQKQKKLSHKVKIFFKLTFLSNYYKTLLKIANKTWKFCLKKSIFVTKSEYMFRNYIFIIHFCLKKHIKFGDIEPKQIICLIK